MSLDKELVCKKCGEVCVWSYNGWVCFCCGKPPWHCVGTSGGGAAPGAAGGGARGPDAKAPGKG